MALGTLAVLVAWVVTWVYAAKMRALYLEMLRERTRAFSARDPSGEGAAQGPVDSAACSLHADRASRSTPSRP